MSKKTSQQPEGAPRDQQIEHADAGGSAQSAENTAPAPVQQSGAADSSAPTPGPPVRDQAALASWLAGQGVRLHSPAHVQRLLPDTIWNGEGKLREGELGKEFRQLLDSSPYLAVRNDLGAVARLAETSDYDWQNMTDVVALVLPLVTWQDNGQPDEASVRRELAALAERSPYLVAAPSGAAQALPSTSGGPGSGRRRYGRRADDAELQRRFPAAYR